MNQLRRVQSDSQIYINIHTIYIVHIHRKRRASTYPKNVPIIFTIDMPNSTILFNATTCFTRHLLIISLARKVDPMIDGMATILPRMRYDFHISSDEIPKSVDVTSYVVVAIISMIVGH